MNNKLRLNEDNIEDLELELELYKKSLELDYNKISYRFGTTNRISPKKLENYNQYHLYNKLYKNEKQRKSLQQKVQIIQPKTARNFIDNNGRFINFSKNKVYDIIKGKHYIMQLGRIPRSTRSKSPTYKSQSCQYTQASFYQGIRIPNMKISTSPLSGLFRLIERIKGIKRDIQNFAKLEYKLI